MGEKEIKTDKPVSHTDFGFIFNRKFFTGKMLLLGLFVSQIIASVHVYLSNTGLFYSLETINNAGYLGIPNRHVMKSLLEFNPAFYGGLFFTLSTGALLSLLGLVSALIWVSIFRRKKSLLTPFLILWAGMIVETNTKGFSPLTTSYFLFIPAVVFTAASRWMPPVQHNKEGYLSVTVRIIPVLLIAILWIMQINSGLFINIRDFLLLSNSPGIKVNNFYYQYTLYPAEAMKSPDQKLLNIYRFGNPGDDTLSNRIRKKLLNYDFLEVNENTALVLSLDKQNDRLSFINEDKIILTVSAKDFLSNIRGTLIEFSSKTDRKDFFKRFTYLSLYTGFPAAMIILFYSMLGFIFNLFFDYRHACTISLFLCLTAAVLLSAIFFHVSGKKAEKENLESALSSDRWQERVTALRIIDKNKIDISRFGNYQEMLSSPHIPVRYWLARALETSRNPDTNRDLTVLMDDPCPNVVCMAYYSTGQRKDKKNIGELLKRIKKSDNWYEQWYAYKALRALGWKQAE